MITRKDPLFSCSRCDNSLLDDSYHVLMGNDGKVTEVLCEDCLDRLLDKKVKT